MSAMQGIMGNICEGQRVSGIKVMYNRHRHLTSRRIEREKEREKRRVARDRGRADRQLIGGSVIWAAQ